MTQTPERADLTAPELSNAVRNALRSIRDEAGYVTAADIRRARYVLNNKVTEQTLWRWAQHDEVPTGSVQHLMRDAGEDCVR